MVKNALQAQLLKAGLVDQKAIKKTNQQQQHAKKTGQDDQTVKAALAQAQREKQEKDQKLNQARQAELAAHALKANVRQMIGQHRLTNTSGDVTYQFVDQGKIKKIYITQPLFDQVVAGYVWIARFDQEYALLPRPLAQKIAERLDEVIVVRNDAQQSTQVDEDDPYAAYIIPDDLMW